MLGHLAIDADVSHIVNLFKLVQPRLDHFFKTLRRGALLSTHTVTLACDLLRCLCRLRDARRDACAQHAHTRVIGKITPRH
jgi:hypothetical protein